MGLVGGSSTLGGLIIMWDVLVGTSLEVVKGIFSMFVTYRFVGGTEG